MKQNRKRNSLLMLGVILAVLAVAGMAMVGAGAADNPTGTKIDGADDLINFLNGTTGTGEGYLTTNIVVSDTLYVKGTKTLDLNGYVIKYDGSAGDCAICLHAVSDTGAITLTLKDGNPTKENYFNDSSSLSGLWVWAGDTATSGTHTVKGGCITGSNLNQVCGGVYVFGDTADATFNMQGGNIVGNSGAGASGVAGGGGVTVYGKGADAKATFSMSGGSICGNCNKSSYGGGGIDICASSSVLFTMTGGTISDNTGTSGTGSGGVYVEGSGTLTFTVGGSAKITGNTGGNVYLPDGKTIGIDSELPLAGEAIIGVTTKTAPTAENPVVITNDGAKNYSMFFSSDNDLYHAGVSDEEVALVNDGSTPHKHDGIEFTKELSDDTISRSYTSKLPSGNYYVSGAINLSNIGVNTITLRF